MNRFRAAIWTEDHWWVVQCLDLDVATQAGSESEALENIREALELHLAEPIGVSSPFQIPESARLIEFDLAEAGGSCTS